MKTKWPTKKLDEVCTLKTGGTPSKTRPEYFGGEIKWLVSGDIHRKEIFDCEGRITKVGLNKSNARILPKDSVIIALNGQGKTRGTVALLRVEATCNQSLVAIIPDERVLDSEFLYWNLHSRYLEIRNLTGMDKRQGLNMRIIRAIEIPLPPLVEQKKIVKVLEEKLGKVKEAIKLREEALADTEKILSARLTEIFEENRKKYKISTLDDVAKLVRGPFGGSLKKEIFVDSGFAVYEQGNVIKGNLHDFRYFITSKKFQEMERFFVQPGDILMSCSGTIGKFVTVPDNFSMGIINQALLKITPKENILNGYLQYSLRDYIARSTSHVTGSAIKNVVGVNVLKKIELPLPNLKIQEKIVKELDELSAQVEELKSLQKEQLKDLKALEQAYLHEAFEGKLI